MKFTIISMFLFSINTFAANILTCTLVFANDSVVEKTEEIILNTNYEQVYRQLNNEGKISYFLLIENGKITLAALSGGKSLDNINEMSSVNLVGGVSQLSINSSTASLMCRLEASSNSL